MIHVRENAANEGFRWGPESSRYDNENSRNLPLDESVSQSVSNQTQILRQRSSIVHHEDGNANNPALLRRSHYISYRENDEPNNAHHMNGQIQNRAQTGAERFSPISQNTSINFRNHNPIPYTNINHQHLDFNQPPPINYLIRRWPTKYENFPLFLYLFA